jgi:NADH-quinone oxidoreductase subunit N
LLYLLVYLVANLGAFAVVIAFELETKSNQIEDYSGLIKRSPLLAGTMVIFLLSLIGIPGTGGFIGKFLVFGAAMRTEFYVLALVAIINSVIAGFYYLNIIRYMFFQDEDDNVITTVQIPGSLTAVIVFSCVFTIVMGIFAQPFINFVQSSLMMFNF